MLFPTDNRPLPPRVGLPDVHPGSPRKRSPVPPAGEPQPRSEPERSGAVAGRRPLVLRPPGSITGGNLTVTLDWVNATFPLGRLGQVRTLLDDVLGASEDGPGMNTYHRSLRWASGAILAWSPGRLEIWLKLPAKALAFFGCPLTLLQALHALGANFTRLDGAIDDRTRDLFPLARVNESASSVVRFKRHESRRPMKDVQSGELEGWAECFGRRGSDGSGRYVRFYDKRLESGGLVDSVRLEVEFSEEPCRQLARELLAADSPEVFAATLAAWVVGSIDFRDRSGSHHHHLSRMPRLEWWELVIRAIGAVRLVVPRAVSTLQARAQWLFTTAMPRIVASLVSTVEALGMDGPSALACLCQRAWEQGQEKLAGWSPGPVDLALDLGALLGPSE